MTHGLEWNVRWLRTAWRIPKSGGTLLVSGTQHAISSLDFAREVEAPGSSTVFSRGCYELARQWLANGENGRPTVNRANRAIRILMRFFSQVHNTLLVFDATAERVCKRLNIAPGGSTRRLLILRGNPPP